MKKENNTEAIKKNELVKVETEKERNDFAIYDIKEIADPLINWWLPDDLGLDKDNDKVYIRKVSNHIEIGKAEIKIIR